LAESAAAIGMAGSAQRSDSIVSIAESEDVVGRAKADGLAEQVAHRPP
jgi:hypothetical protein